MFVVEDTSVGNTDGRPVDVGVGLSCNPPDPRAGGSGHRRQAAAPPLSEEERSSQRCQEANCWHRVIRTG